MLFLLSTGVDGLVDVTVDQEATTQVSEAQHLWNAAAQVLRAQVSEAVWHSTFSDARPTSLDSGLLVMAVPSTLVKERIQGRYEAMVRDALAEVGVPGVELHIEVLPDVLPSGGELDGVDGFDSILATSPRGCGADAHARTDAALALRPI